MCIASDNQPLHSIYLSLRLKWAPNTKSRCARERSEGLICEDYCSAEIVERAIDRQARIPDRAGARAAFRPRRGSVRRHPADIVKRPQAAGRIAQHAPRDPGIALRGFQSSQRALHDSVAQRFCRAPRSMSCGRSRIWRSMPACPTSTTSRSAA